jgi:hypothetical protein
VPNSPFAAPGALLDGPTPLTPPSGLISISGEPSGTYIYAGYSYITGTDPTYGSAWVVYQIDTTGSSPTLQPLYDVQVPTLSNQSNYYYSGKPVSLLTDSRGLYLYVGQGPSVETQNVSAGASVYSIAGSTYEGIAGSAATYGTAYAIDPLDRFYYVVAGQDSFIVTCGISPSNGTATNCVVTSELQYLGFNATTPPQIEYTGNFLFIPGSNSANPQGVINIFSIDSTTGLPTQTGTFAAAGTEALIADPLGPYLYSSDISSIHAFQNSSGTLTEISGSPFSVSGLQCCYELVITGSLAVPVSGPGAVLFPAAAGAFSATAGANSTPQTFTLTNNGTESLTINSIAISGTNSSSFGETNTCGSTLATNASCSITVTFSPASAGSFSATLQVTDNAGNSPQTLALSGTGVAAAPFVSFTPTSFTFTGTTTVGSTAGPQAITVTNTGTGPLNVTGVALGGPNPGDFSQTNTCVGGAVAVNATCAVNVTFAPQAAGTRSATVTLTDNAPGGTQSFSVSGSGTAPFQLGPGPSAPSGTNTTVSPGQTAQYPLQLTPAAGFTGAVSLGCSGAPELATCAVSPSAVNVTAGSSPTFTVSVTTTGTASSFSWPFGGGRPIVFRTEVFCVVAAWLLFLVMRGRRVSPRLSFLAAGILLMISVSVVVAGCGGGGGSATSGPSPSPSTPAGTYTLTVTATARNVPAQNISLTLVVN